MNNKSLIAIHRLRFALFHAPDLKVRALMGAASFGWAVDLLLHPDLLDRPYYTLMRMLPAWLWVVSYALHWLGASYLIARDVQHGRLASWVNGWGALVWFAATFAQNLTAGRFLITTSLEMLCSLELFIIWARTLSTEPSSQQEELAVSAQ